MRNRNTLGEHWKPRGLANSIERKTVTANNPNILHSQKRQQNSNHSNQQMAKTITETLIKLPNQLKRSSISTSLKPNQKTLFSTISSFIFSIDRQFDQSSLEFDMIIQLLNFFGYPHNYSKTVFQPVGAPHTWHSCLQMMQFLAQIANYYFQYKLHLHQMQVEQPSYMDLIFESFLEQDQKILEQYHQKQIYKLKKQNQQLAFRIQSGQLTLKNLKNSQRSLTVLTEQQSTLLQKLEFQNQNVIQIDQKNTSIINQIQRAQDQIEENNIQKNRLMNRISTLQQQINTQQLSVDQATKMQYEIKQFHSKITKLKDQHQKNRNSYEKQKKQLLQLFFNTEKQLLQINESVKKYEDEIAAKQIDIPKPIINRNQFMKILNDDNQCQLKQKLCEIIDTSAISSMLNQQHSLLAILQMEEKQLKQNSSDVVGKKNNSDSYMDQINQQLENLNSIDKENQQEYQKLLNQKQQLQIQQQTFLNQKQNLNIQKQDMINEQLHLNTKISEGKQLLKNNLPKVRIYQQQAQRILQEMDKKIEETQASLGNTLDKIYDEFKQLKQQIQ